MRGWGVGAETACRLLPTSITSCGIKTPVQVTVLNADNALLLERVDHATLQGEPRVLCSCACGIWR